MAINLKGILADVSIDVNEKEREIRVVTPIKECFDEAESLPAPLHTYTLFGDTVLIEVRGIDILTLAEKLALSWEEKGYKIERLVSTGTNRSGDLKTKKIQSFILV
jgi:hypothetical protein